MSRLKRRIADFFLGTVRELAGRLHLKRDPVAIERFLDAVLSRDLFYNLRDFSGAFEGLVRPGVLFRCSAMSRWEEDPEFERWREGASVCRVVDFRDPEEARSKLSYSLDARRRLGVRNLPLSENPLPNRTTHDWSVGEKYYRDFLAYTHNVVEALRVISEPIDGSVAVHCYAGKDRTGWFCAIIGVLLGLDEELVVHDYLLSGQDTQEESIREFLKCLGRDGGARADLLAAGFAPKDLLRLRRRLLADV